MVYDKVGLPNFFSIYGVLLFYLLFFFSYHIMKSSPSPPPLQGIGALLRALPVLHREPSAGTHGVIVFALVPRSRAPCARQHTKSLPSFLLIGAFWPIWA